LLPFRSAANFLALAFEPVRWSASLALPTTSFNNSLGCILPPFAKYSNAKPCASVGVSISRTFAYFCLLADAVVVFSWSNNSCCF
jgi:hypothetical protein